MPIVIGKKHIPIRGHDGITYRFINNNELRLVAYRFVNPNKEKWTIKYEVGINTTLQSDSYGVIEGDTLQNNDLAIATRDRMNATLNNNNINHSRIDRNSLNTILKFQGTAPAYIIYEWFNIYDEEYQTMKYNC